MMITKPDGEILKAYKAACLILGMREEEIIELGREGLVGNDQNLGSALKFRSQAGFFSGELTFIQKSGKRIPVELTSSVFEDFRGEERTSLVFRDISGQKEAEEVLNQEKEFTEITINSTPGIFFVLDENGNVIRWNDNSIKVFGMTPEQIDGRPAVDFVHEDDKELVVQVIKQAFEQGHAAVDLKLYSAGNTTAIYKFIANRFIQNGRLYIVGSGIDFTL